MDILHHHVFKESVTSSKEERGKRGGGYGAIFGLSVVERRDAYFPVDHSLAQ